jgi:superfamily II DNA or RNA helicase
VATRVCVDSIARTSELEKLDPAAFDVVIVDEIRRGADVSAIA